MKVAELTNNQLDHLVATAEGIEVRYTHALECWRVMGEPTEIQWLPHRDWSQAGPIIEREGISICKESGADETSGGNEAWLAYDSQRSHQQRGTTPLVAAMRAYVASKFGDDVPTA